MLYLISTLLNGLTLGSIYALIAVGYTMVYGIIKLINFAHGEFYMFGAFVGYYVLVFIFGGKEGGRELGVFALLTAALIAGLATGLLAIAVERVVYRPLRKSGRVVALLAALGVSLLLQNYAQQSVGAKVKTFPNTFTVQRYPREQIDASSVVANAIAERDIAVIYSVPKDGGRLTQIDNIAQSGNPIEAEKVAGMNALLQRSVQEGTAAAVYRFPAVTVANNYGVIILALALISVLLYALVQHTRFGRAMRAVSHDFDAAALMGIDVNRVVAGTFFVGAFVAGIGGTLGGGMYYCKIFPLMGVTMGLKAFVAAVIGGIGSIPGAVLGALALGVAEALVIAYGNSLHTGLSLYSDAVTFGILILMLLVRPSGLLGKPASDKL